MPPVIFHRSNDCGIFDLKHILIGLIALCAMDRHTEPTALDELMLIGRVCLRNRWLKCVMVWQSSSPPRFDGSFCYCARLCWRMSYAGGYLFLAARMSRWPNVIEDMLALMFINMLRI